MAPICRKVTGDLFQSGPVLEKAFGVPLQWTCGQGLLADRRGQPQLTCEVGGSPLARTQEQTERRSA